MRVDLRQELSQTGPNDAPLALHSFNELFVRDGSRRTKAGCSFAASTVQGNQADKLRLAGN
jgi:hypothetical protein